MQFNENQMLFCKSNVLYLQVHGSLSGKCWENNNSARASFNSAISFLSRLIDTPPLPPPIRSKLIDVYCICSWTNHKKRKSLKFWFFNIIIFLSNMTRYFIATLWSIHLRINRNSKMLMFSCRRYRLCRGRNPYMYII